MKELPDFYKPAFSKFSHLQIAQLKQWARMDSNHRTPKRTDLQSVAVGHLATCPAFKFFRASGGIRTPDQLITNQLLWPTELHWRLDFFK